jgi:PTS system N-acetylglucosamine-specific IIC component
MFLAPMLYLVHAVLTGIAMVVMNALGVKLGFGFSAGLFDYVLNYNLATRPLWLIPVGAVYFAIYYFSFRFFILRFDLKTLGREPLAEAGPAAAVADGGDRAAGFVAALGGPANLQSVEACMTRLRLILADPNAIDEAALRALGARGVLRLGDHDLQVVLGPIADAVASEIRAHSRGSPANVLAPPVDLAATIRRALAATVIRRAEGRGSRLIVDLDDADRADLIALDAPGIRGVARAAPNTLHILVQADTENLAAQL